MTAALALDSAIAPPNGGRWAIEAIGIDKWFGPVHANRDVTLRVAKGSIHGIVGENGAGKSTLMNILYGYHRADRGEIRIDGKTADIGRPSDAITLGVGMVHQHFMQIGRAHV